ncbi:TolC family protein [Aequorivita sp. H23M31]|uniref:TolC family protein n=1 Tax=Aequorivita ciconiae TaxID=2494375 RepID=A0A410G5Q6_9FLAO|nr:TolC family protein [Aequorivita sp. H23M31]QAA82634.1 TolC family protein [Aequorivita sp. H23M31]
MRFQKSILIVILVFSFCFQLKAQENISLKQALQTAKTNNPVLKAERFNVKMAESYIVTAKLRPNLILSHETLQVAESSDFAPQTSWHSNQNREMLWELSKPLQIAGQRKNKIAVANHNYSFEEKVYGETERNLFFEVANKWLEVWEAQKQLQIIESAKSNIDSLLFTNQVRYRNQVITQTDLFRTELLAKQYNIQHKTARQEVENHQKEFGFLLGMERGVKIDITDAFLWQLSENLESLLMQALENRSDMQATKSLMEVSESNVKLQKSLAYPEPEVGIIYNAQHSVPHLGISFSLDLPFFNRNQGEIQKSHQLREQAEQNLTALQQQIQTEVSIAFANYKLQQQNIADYEQLLEQSQTILNNVKHAYLRGGTTIIDFLEAQTSWLETQQEYFETVHSFRQSYVQLFYATGLINQLAL